jgi:CHAT domain-containing protein
VTSELAVAFALRAEAENRPSDFGAALNYAAESVSGNAAPAFAYFNLAVITDKIPLPRIGLEQWEAAAKSEQDPAWRAEAETHRQEMAQLLQTHEHDLKALRDPESIRTSLPSLPGALETMQQAALQSWIVMDPPPLESLQFLANEFAERNDRWWRDFMAAPWDRRANVLLSKTVTNVGAGKYAEGEGTGAQAEALFDHNGNVAGRLRARRERLEASHRGDDDARACTRLLTGVISEVSRRSYPWLQGQIVLDEITCRTLRLNGPSLDDRLNAFSNIEKTGFEGISLRSLAFLAEPWVSASSPLAAWSRALRGLPRFWASRLGDYRAYHFAWNLAQAGRMAGYLDAERMLLRESALDLSNDPRTGLRAALLSDLAAAEARAGHYSEADKSLTEARGTQAVADSTQYRDEIEVQSDQVDLLERRPEAILSRSGPAGKPEQARGMYRADRLNASGSALLMLQRYTEAEHAFAEVIALNSNILKKKTRQVERDSVAKRYDFAFRGLTEAQLRRGEPAAASLWSWLNYRARSSEAHNYPVPNDGSILLAFAELPGGVSAWLADAAGVEQHWINSANLQELVSRLNGLASDSEAPENAIRTAAREVESVLLGPFKSRLPGPTSGETPVLAVVADGSLQKIPWPLLENEKGESLILRYSIVQSNGQLPASSEGRRRISSASKTTVMADPLLDPADENFPPLKDAVAEGQRIAKRFPSVTFLKEREVTEAAFVDSAAAAEVLHFAGHGVSNGGMGGLLVSGQPRFLTAEQISGLRLSGLQLVVLSACSSGVAGETPAEDSDVLMRAFLNAGAARVLASTWAVDSLATTQLMDFFYTRLLSGELPVRALRSAILELRSHSIGAHPSAWAAFQLYGRP